MTVGEVFLGAFLALLVQTLTSPEFREVAGRWKVKKKMNELLSTLKTIEGVINDAEEQQIKDPAVKSWLEELKYVAYDVEDILDQFSTEVLRRKSKVEFKTIPLQVRRKLIVSSLSVPFFKFGMGSKIDMINKKLEEIAKKRDFLSLKEGVVGRSFGVTPTATTSLPSEPCVYGREEDKEKIIELLRSDELNGNEVSVIPIIGLPGVGKTTLARIVYNDDRVEQHFGLRVWVYVSQEFEILKVTKAIHEIATKRNDNLDQLQSLQDNLQKLFTTHKFLIVLDGVWNEDPDKWQSLLTPFRWGKKGSKIIVTTRNETVSKIVPDVVDAHQLNVLSDENCLSLFEQHALVDRNSNTYSQLKEIGMQIVKKCKGLPLAAKALGDLLRSKPIDEWRKIQESEIWELEEAEAAGILPALRLSYHHLQGHLRQCFAYCSIFPKGYEFDKEKLVLLWMAEGFLQTQGGEQMEDIGDKCFDELLQRSFFQRSSRNRSMFVMHDLMNDLAKSVSRGICFRLEEKLEGGQGEDFMEKARHSSYLRGQYESVTKFEAFYKAKYLRTFLPLTELVTEYEYEYSYLHKQVLHGLFSKLRCLRVLCLSRYYITELPESIINLKNLRYLDLSYTPVKRLPDSICALYTLQTLILIGCYDLCMFPYMGNLINLRHLVIDSLEEKLWHIGRLTSLQKLSRFVVGNSYSASNIRELRSLLHIRGNLRIEHLENVDNVNDVVEANLRNKHHLRGLELHSYDSYDNRLITENGCDGLKPPLELEELTIDLGNVRRLPYWIGDSASLSKLMHLTLYRMHGTSLPPPGQLPSLKTLDISQTYSVTTVGHEFYGDGVGKPPFPSLEELTFKSMGPLWRWSSVEKEEFPCLREIRIMDCPRLRFIEPRFPTLVKLKTENCRSLQTLPLMFNPRDPSSEAVEGNSSMVSTLGHPSPKAEKGIHPSFVGKSKEKEGAFISCCREIIIKNRPILHWELRDALFPYLEKLRIHVWLGMGNLRKLPSLGQLDLEACDESILKRLVDLTSLYSLRISRFKRLRRLDEGLLRPLKALEDLEISNCAELEDLGNQVGLQHLVSPRRLVILECLNLYPCHWKMGCPSHFNIYIFDIVMHWKCCPIWVCLLSCKSSPSPNVVNSNACPRG